MATLNKLIEQFSIDSTDISLCLKVAQEYERLEQYASAVSFYLKAAEFSKHDVDTYAALMKVSACFQKQDNRDHTVENALLQAIALIPNRPEAYLSLSQYYERKKEWQKCYTVASIGYSTYENNPDLPIDFGFSYPALEFQMAIAAWWIGRQEESKRLLISLSKRVTDPVYKEAIKNNLILMDVDVTPTVHEMADRVNAIRELLALEVADVEYERFGSTGDGGYVMANDITDKDFLVSFGVGDNVDFEYALSLRGVKTHLYDYTVEQLPRDVPDAFFYQEKIGPEDTTISDAIARAPSKNNLLLKMDIEGAEFETIASTPLADLQLFRQITLEVHWMNQLEDYPFYIAARNAFQKLRATHFPVLVHANNDRPLMVLGNAPVPVVFEVLYLNRDLYKFEEKKDPFQGLLSKNLEALPEMGLSFP